MAGIFDKLKRILRPTPTPAPEAPPPADEPTSTPGTWEAVPTLPAPAEAPPAAPPPPPRPPPVPFSEPGLSMGLKPPPGDWLPPELSTSYDQIAYGPEDEVVIYGRGRVDDHHGAWAVRGPRHKELPRSLDEGGVFVPNATKGVVRGVSDDTVMVEFDPDTLVHTYPRDNPKKVIKVLHMHKKDVWNPKDPGLRRRWAAADDIVVTAHARRAEVDIAVRRGPVYGSPSDPTSVVYYVRWPNGSVFEYELEGYQARVLEQAFAKHKSQAKFAVNLKLRAVRARETRPKPSSSQDS